MHAIGAIHGAGVKRTGGLQCPAEATHNPDRSSECNHRNGVVFEAKAKPHSTGGARAASDRYCDRSGTAQAGRHVGNAGKHHGKVGETGSSDTGRTTSTHREYRAKDEETCGVSKLQEGRCTSLPARTSRDCSKTPISLLPVSHAYRVNGRVNGGQASFVVDTGAAITLLDKTLWDKLNTAGHVLTPSTGPPLVGVEGTGLETWGTSTAEISFAGETFQFPVLVASSLTILGMDFLDKNRCTLEKVLRFPDRGISVSLRDSSLEPHIVQARVTLEETL